MSKPVLLCHILLEPLVSTSSWLFDNLSLLFLHSLKASFALSYLLGIELMPRIRNWKDLDFLRPHEDEVYDYIEPLFDEMAEWKLIQTHWLDLMRVVLSIKAGKLLPSTVFRKLGSYSRKNRLYQAFQALGKVIRTMYLLRFISDRSLRRERLSPHKYSSLISLTILL